MVFLRPTLIRDGENAEPLTNTQYDRVLSDQNKAKPKPHPILPDLESPSLPPRPPKAPAIPEEVDIPDGTGPGIKR
ncbi:MAG: hypothetical protein ABIT23_09190, partial [Nitrosospira sp.]